MSWEADNRAALFAEIAQVACALAGEAADAEEPDGARAALERPSAVDTLSEMFALSSFERAVLVACAGVELRGEATAGVPFVTFGLALGTLPDAHFSATSPQGALRQFQLVQLGGDELLSARLRIDERVLHYLLGVPARDARLRGLIEPVPAMDPGDLPASHAALVARLVAVWERERAEPCPIVQLCGADQADKLAIAAAAAARVGVGLNRLRAADVPAGGAERETLARLCEREAALAGCALVVEVEEGDPPEAQRSVPPLIERLGTLTLVSARSPVPLPHRTTLRVDVERLTPAEQERAWQRVLGTTAELAPVAAQFRLGMAGFDAAAAEVRERLADGDTTPLARLVWSACRVQARPRLDGLAQRIETRAGWDELVLPPAKLRLLRDLAAHVRHHDTVHEKWGFARRGARGLGITALFAGATGTGKTMAAEVLAGELDLDLYKIDLSQVVSKYIGETEKNLRRIFDAAEYGGALLLFDEADALFGKRSEVKDSHDRYANLEVSYLLQCMEEYRGLAVLTTNMRGALDHAFLRRLRFIVEFPFPDVAQRVEIWRRAFPAATPLGAVDHDRLARFKVSGGVIRSIALNAAFLAADAGEPIGMEHLNRAAHDEFVKLEKPYQGDV